jgi:hypothetical protein
LNVLEIVSKVGRKGEYIYGLVLWGCLIPIINTTFIKLSTTAYLLLFFPYLVPRLNLLNHLSKSDRNQTASSCRPRYRCKLDFPVEKPLFCPLLEW